jgi:putative DNA primase/helicase
MKIPAAQIEKLQALAQGEMGGKLNEYNLTRSFSEIFKNKSYYCENWGQFLMYEGRYYKRQTPDDTERVLVQIVTEVFPHQIHKLTKSFLSSTYKLLALLFERQVEDLELDHHYWSFEDGLLNTKTMQQQEHTPDVICFKFIPVYMSEFETPTPVFNRFIETTMVNEEREFDPELADLYQEMLGSLFLGHKEVNRAFFFYGEGSNGKSVSTEFILSLFEKQYTASASLESLTSTRFGLSRIIGKLANVCTEDESEYLKNSVIKALVTGEQVESEIKFGGNIAFHSYAKLIFSTNKFPKFGGLDYAMKRRIIVIPFHAKFEGKNKDANLQAKLQKEKAGIIWYALQGAKRLISNEYMYTIGETSERGMQFFEEESSPIARFVAEEFDLEAKRPSRPYLADAYYDAYREWCKDNGYGVVASGRFYRELATVNATQPYKERNNGRTYYYLHPPARKAPPVVV